MTSSAASSCKQYETQDEVMHQQCKQMAMQPGEGDHCATEATEKVAVKKAIL
jgi:hypothetical protein